MARPRKTEAPDLAKPCELTAGAIERLTCPAGKAQAFLRDAQGNGLRVRVTPTGKKTFVFEQSLNNQTIRRSIGEVTAWSIADARTEAKQLSLMLDAGTDPRELEREQAESLRVFRSCPLITPKDAHSSLQILAIARYSCDFRLDRTPF